MDLIDELLGEMTLEATGEATSEDGVTTAAATETPAIKPSKADLVRVGLERGLATPAKLWKMTIPTIEKLVGELTPAETAVVVRLRQARRRYDAWTKRDLEAEADRLGIPKSQANREKLIDALVAAAAPPAPAVDLDEDQAALLARLEEPALLVSAGPGAGKTTTLCALVRAALAAHPDARVLVLAYNREAENILQSRLRALGVQIQHKSLLRSEEVAGCFVLTFDKYVWWRDGGDQTYDVADVFELDEAEAPAAAAPAVVPASQAPSQAPSQEDDFRKAFERGAARPAPATRWDWVVVDEAQDVDATRARVLDGLRPRAAHFVAAGDPRQELYAGTSWFSTSWADTPAEQRHTLRYNHRSGRAIVDFLNRYSREHFPSLHFDQIASRADEGAVTTLVAAVAAPTVAPAVTASAEPDERLRAVGEAVGGLLADSTAAAAYAVAPVTIRKFNTETVTATARQVLHERHPFVNARRLDENDSSGVLDDKSFFLGSSYKLKGSERGRVVAFQVDAPYARYGIENILKLLFVALSRARDELFIVLSRPAARGDTLFSLVGDAARRVDGSARREPPPPPPGWLAVSDLVEVDAFGPCDPRAGLNQSFPPLTIPSAQGDADFIGMFVEAHVASAAGVTLQAPRPRPARTLDRGAGHRVVIEPLGYACTAAGAPELVIHPDRWAAFRAEYDRLVARFDTAPEYALAAMDFTARVGRPWTVSERFADFRPDAAELAGVLAVVRGWLGPRVAHSTRAPSRTVLAARTGGRDPASRPLAVSVVGIYDLSGGEGRRVVELKHAAPSPKHRRQAAIYAVLAGAASALLVNTREGTAEVVPACSSAVLDSVVRAHVLLKVASGRAVVCPGRLRHRAQTAVLVAVDVETDGAGRLTEIGAVAVAPGSDRPIAVFSRLADGLAEREPGLFGTGLAVRDRARFAADSPRLAADFRRWVRSVTGLFTALHWGGNEAKLFRPEPDEDASPEPVETVDVYERYRVWLSKNEAARRDGMKLGDAAAHLLGGERLFAPHRAFEDAAATAAIFSVICATGGVN